jgi:hypothetical protein
MSGRDHGLEIDRAEIDLSAVTILELGLGLRHGHTYWMEQKTKQPDYDLWRAEIFSQSLTCGAGVGRGRAELAADFSPPVPGAELKLRAD